MPNIKLTIEVPEKIYHFVMNTGTYGHYRFNTAEAIRKGEVVEECDDCVSRQAVNDLYDKYRPCLATRAYEFFGEELKALPSVLPKREQGEWIFEEVGVRTQVLKCSKCGTIIQRGENFTQEEFRKYINDILREKCITLDNFCYNCGAKMR